MIRHDYAYPLRIDAGAGQVARAATPITSSRLIRQLLLTSPGERVCLPEFGCGLRRLVFAGAVRRAGRDGADPGAAGDDGAGCPTRCR